MIVCLRVFVRTIKPKRPKLKSSSLTQRQSITSPRPPINIRSNGQGHKVQKGHRLVYVSYTYTLMSAQPLVPLEFDGLFNTNTSSIATTDVLISYRY